MKALGAMRSSSTRSARLARALILAFGLVCFAQLTSFFEWDEAWFTIATVAVPLALAFAAPRLCTRGGLAAHGSDVSVAWWTLAAWLFAPWALGSCALESWQRIPWNLLYESPCDCATIKSVASTHIDAYLAGVTVSGIVLLTLWIRSRLPTINGWMFALALATFVLTNFGGLCLVAIVGLAIT